MVQRGWKKHDRWSRIKKRLDHVTQGLRDKSMAARGRVQACVICRIGLRATQRSNSAIRALCQDCDQSIPWIRQVCCDVCGRSHPCADCGRLRRRYFHFSRSAVEYSPLMREWLADYKYRGHERLGPVMAQMMQYGLRQLLQDARMRLADIEYCTYVPVSEERLKERGFNQAEQIAKALGRMTGIPVVSLLERQRHTSKQSSKSRAGRISDLQDAFVIRDVDDGLVEERRKLLLIDDVYTTGSTMNECSRVLQQHYPVDVYGLTWAR